MVRRHRPVLYVENDRLEKQRALISQIDALGYRMYWHTPPLADAPNYKGVTEFVFDRNYLSLNMLCLPKERGTKTDLEPIDPAAPHQARRLGGAPAR